MKKVVLFLCSVMLCSTCVFADIIHGKIAGTVIQINESKREIVIRCADAKVPINMGCRLYVPMENAIVPLEVSFPMMASATCKLPAAFSSYIKSIIKGQTVYFGSGPITTSDRMIITTVGENKNIFGIDMIALAGGTFMMGGSDDDPDAQINEKPLHRVSIDPFWISKFEISQKQYVSVMGINPSSFIENENNPVEGLSWYDTVEFCNALSKKAGLKSVYIIDKTKIDLNNTNSTDTYKWIVKINTSADGFRIPTEAEWEFACRGGTDTCYSSGNKFDGDYSWYSGNTNDKSHPVGKKKPNKYGLYDMSGNVWEWCWDWNTESFYLISTENNPSGSVSGSEKILRGGSWINSEINMRSSGRNWAAPCDKSNNIGIRVVLAGVKKSSR